MIQLTSEQQALIRDGLCARVRDPQLDQEFMILSRQTMESLCAAAQTTFKKVQQLVAERVPDPSAYIAEHLPELADLATRTAFM